LGPSQGLSELVHTVSGQLRSLEAIESLLLAVSGLLRAVLIPFRVAFGSFWTNLD
jgi:hypothetical protein